MTIKCELAEVRRQQTKEWETTKHHLKLAKATSLEDHEKCDQSVTGLLSMDVSESRQVVMQV